MRNRNLPYLFCGVAFIIGIRLASIAVVEYNDARQFAYALVLIAANGLILLWYNTLNRKDK